MSSSTIWAGPALSPATVETSSCVSPAGAWWNSRFVASLAAMGKPSFVISHLPEPLWPRGQAHVAREGNVANRTPGTLVHYFNVPGLRSSSLFWSYLHASREALPQPRTLVTYNPYPYALALGHTLVQRYSCRWVPIFADAVSDHPVYRRFRDYSLQYAYGTVFLSWRDYIAAQEEGRGPTLHLDGGIDLVREPEVFDPPSRPTVLYTGALNQHAGIETLVGALEFLDPQIQVVVCGKGSSKLLSEAVASRRFGDRLQVHGMVDEPTLHRLSLEATCFVNPRPTGAASQHNFPSKVLRYLSYGQPIASTRTPGLSPDYERALTFADSGDPRDVATSIKRAIASTTDRFAAESRRAFVAARSWDRQAERFLHFLCDQ